MIEYLTQIFTSQHIKTKKHNKINYLDERQGGSNAAKYARINTVDVN